MRSGGALLGVALAGMLVTSFGCGSPNPPPKASGPAPSPAPAPAPTGAAGSGSIAAGDAQDPATQYTDPSKLLDSYAPPSNPDANSSNEPQKPSKSGLVLEVRERGPEQPWLLIVTNRGGAPVDLFADTRLLWFEVKLPGKKKQSVCKLPEPLAPGTQPEPRLVVHLEPNEGVADQFDPRLYCFAEGDQKLLVPGAEVTPHFGWPEAPPKKVWKRGKRVEEPVLQKPPFVARQSLETDIRTGGGPFGVTPKAAARLTSAGVTGSDKELEGNPMVLRSEYAAWARQSQPLKPPTDGDETPTGHPMPPQPAIVLRLVQGSDARAEHEATIKLTVANQSPLPTYVYFRREMISFEVAGPAGITQCPGRLDDRTPERNSFLRLARRGAQSYDCRLAELCPRGTFASPGLYLVYARFDATMSGREQGIEAFVGPVYSRSPATVRIRTGEEAIFQKRPMMRLNLADGSSRGSQGVN